MSSRSLDLLDLFKELDTPSGPGDLYAARSLDRFPSCRLARDTSGNAALLVASKQSSAAPPAPVALRNLIFEPRCVCRVKDNRGGDSLETLAVLKCVTDDVLLREYFVRCLDGVLAGLPRVATEEDVAGLVATLAELFRALEIAPQRSLQGLWCELLLISRARDISHAAAAWHAERNSIHDFTSGNQRLEVKSTIGPLRVHQFQLAQLLSPRGTQTIIASFVLDESGKGISIAELWGEVAQRSDLSVDLKSRLTKIMALCLGKDWRFARRAIYDPVAALKQLRLYAAEAVPQVDSNFPTEVSDVRFKAELTSLPPLSRRAVTLSRGLLEAVFG